MENRKQRKELPQCPRERASFVSYLCFWWVLPVLFKGSRKELDYTDLYQPLQEHKADSLGNKLWKAWEDEVESSLKKNKKPWLIRAAFNVFKGQFAFLGFVLLMAEMFLRMTQPFFVGGLIVHYSGKYKDINIAYLYAGAIIIGNGLGVIVMYPYLLSILHLGMKVRIALCSIVYRKSLRLSKNTLGSTTAGQIVNMLSNDVGRLDTSTIFLHYLWIGPLQTVLVTYLTYLEIGIAAIYGATFTMLMIPLQIFLASKISVLRFKTALKTDQRVRIMNEVIQGIEVIKMYAWERPFEKIIALARQNEIQIICYVSYIRGILLSFIMFITRVSIFVSLVAYLLLGFVVTAEKAFIITSYFNILRQSMSCFFPQGVDQLAETLVSFGRIERYMMKDELHSDTRLAKFFETLPRTSKPERDLTPKPALKAPPPTSAPCILINNVKAKWSRKLEEYTLDNINLNIQPQTLVAIIGPVGAGKSSLIEAILGELQIESGEMKITGTISYASQEPWLFSASIRQNILFGLPMEKDRYRTVVKKCALEKDFELLADGDRTIVGERGASLSGGQKARVNLARACYRRAAIYLLDNPLSAVDTHVGKDLFEQCIKDFLKNKIVILVTHQLQYLPTVDQIVLLEDGKMKSVGNYESLKVSDFDFAKLLSENIQDKEVQEEQTQRLSVLENRQINFESATSLNSLNEDITKGSPMVVDENRSTGKIEWHVYKSYIKAGGGYLAGLVLGCLFSVAQLAGSCCDFFLSYWVNNQEKTLEKASISISNNSKAWEIDNSTNKFQIDINPVNLITGSTQFDINPFQITQYIVERRDMNTSVKQYDDVDKYINLDILIYGVIVITTVLLTLSRSFCFFNFAMRASKNLHNSMFHGLNRSAMYFFHTNPSGRILNRFSKDLGLIDEILPIVAMDVVQIFLKIFGIVILIIIINFYLLVPTMCLSYLIYNMRSFYLRSSRNIKRMEGTTRSPIFSHLAASLDGLSTIRAHNAQNILEHEFDHYQDVNSSSFYLAISTSLAFGFYLDACCFVYIIVVTLSFFWGDEAMGGNVGLAITQAMTMSSLVQWGVRQSADVENEMTAVERVVEYQNIGSEGALESTKGNKPPNEWPEHGEIKFQKFSLSYFPGDDSELVLKDLDITINPQEKVGIVGRTGAGKSSLVNALFRLSYNKGLLTIDSRDIEKIGLNDLRSKISIIPQEPVLFSGTMYYNLDPFGDFSDEKLWIALDDVKLKNLILELPGGLNTLITEGGSNFSVGQRQLVCLARAILRQNKILIMDEATANVDPLTDALIQTTIRSKFINCTVLTVAHRLNTVIDSDKIIVMDAGRVVEYGTPYDLLTNETGPKILQGMAKQMGTQAFDNFVKLAFEASLKKDLT